MSALNCKSFLSVDMARVCVIQLEIYTVCLSASFEYEIFSKSCITQLWKKCIKSEQMSIISTSDYCVGAHVGTTIKNMSLLSKWKMGDAFNIYSADMYTVFVPRM